MNSEDFELREGNKMSEKELQILEDLLEKLTDEDEKAVLKHAIFIIESNNHIY